jgi:chloramphenicol 3-O-phosphotransferase
MTEDKELEMAVEILEAFNRAGISYRVHEDGSFDFHDTADLERANEISQEIQKRY